MEINPERCLTTLSKSEHSKEEHRVANLLAHILKEAPALDPSSGLCVDILSSLLYKFRILMLTRSDMSAHRLPGTTLRGYGDFLDSAVAFANSIWSVEEQARFTHCIPERASDDHFNGPIAQCREEFKRVRGPEHTAFQESIILVFRLLADVCANIKCDHKTALKLERKPGTTKWPHSPSKFIPQGPSVAVAAFSAWARSAGHVTPLFLLSELAFICPSIRSAMIEDAALLGLVEELFLRHVAWLQRTTHSATSMDKNYHLLCITHDIDMHLSLFIGDWFRDRIATPDFVRSNIQTLSSLYHALAAYRPLLDKLSFYRGEEHDAYAHAFGFAALDIKNALSEISQPLPSYPILESALHSSPQLPVNVYMLIPRVNFIRGRPECAGGSCTRTGEQTKANLSMCSQCQTIRYCSKECQQSDWRNHKLACKMLKAFLPIALTYGNGNLSKAETVRQVLDDYRQTGMQSKDLLFLGQYLEKHDQKYRRSLPRYPQGPDSSS